MGLKDGKRTRFIIGFILPALVLYCMFFIYPFVHAFYISLFEWSGMSKDMKFIGLDNFKRLFSDPVVFESLWHNIYFLIISAIITFFLALFFSIVLTKKNYRENKFYKIVFFFPYVLSIIIVSILWMFVYNPTFGLLNSFLKAIGLESAAKVWLGNPETVLPALIVPQIWMFVGFYMVLFIAGIMNIPKTFYEAAIIDGASEFKQAIYITIPLLWEIIRTALIFFVINAFSHSFNIVFIVTKGGPNRSSELITTYLYEQAFANSNYGYATAIGVFMFVVVFVISTVILKATKREVYEY